MSTILIIEDDRDIAELVSIHMNDAGFETEKVHDGKEGFILAMEGTYELIILDNRIFIRT